MCQLQSCFKYDGGLYEALGVPSSASSSEVSSAYRRVARRTHPDKGGSAEAFHHIAFAFEVLSCPVTRSLYDKQQKHLKEQQHASHSPLRDVFLACATSDSLHAHQAGSKQHMVDADIGLGNVKSKNGSFNSRAAEKVPSWQVRLHHALAHLKSVLQSMEADRRRITIKKLPSSVRMGLLGFMEKHPNVSAPKSSPRLSRSHPSGMKMSNHRGLTTIHSVQKKKKYQARIRIKDMRLYTREHFDFDTAVEHQILLAQLRHEIADEMVMNPVALFEPQRLVDKCLGILSQHGVTEEGLGLGVFLEFRASAWCGPRCTISTPSYRSLKEALQMNARLLRACSTSWEALRKEWIELLMIPRRGQPKSLSLKEAEDVADAARLRELQRQLDFAVNKAETAFAHKAQKMRQACKAEQRRRLRERKEFWKIRRRQARI